MAVAVKCFNGLTGVVGTLLYTVPAGRCAKVIVSWADLASGGSGGFDVGSISTNATTSLKVVDQHVFYAAAGQQVFAGLTKYSFTVIEENA